MTTTIEEKLYNDLHYQICNDLGVGQSDSSEFAAKMCVIIAKRYAASLNRQGWTRVEDGNLPAQGERVLVYCEGGLIEKGYRIGGLWERDWAGTTFHEAGYKVTHWMPLPNKPSI